MEIPPLTAERVLTAWERCDGLPPPGQALAILAAAGLGASDEFLTLTVGQRDALLLRVREATFGQTLRMRTVCPQCRRTMDANVDVAEIEASGSPPDPGADSLRVLDLDGWRVVYRLPTADDLERAGHARTMPDARESILTGCVSSVYRDGVSQSPLALPSEICDALADAIEAWDPLVEAALAMECATCGHAWQAVLEIGSYLYAEISDAALRVVREVAELAGRYGWREADILAMSAARRRAYLENAG